MSYGDYKAPADEGPKPSDRPATIHFKRMGRELAMQYLFQCDLNGEAGKPETMEAFWAQAEESGEFPGNRVFRKARAYAEKLIVGVTNELAAIDALIGSFSEKWEIDRMAVVDRNILRVSIYELKNCPDIPPLVSIDEAIEISKDFGSEKSSMFINGILNGVKDSLGRTGGGQAARR